MFRPRLGWKGNISFIFDTGADNSVLMPTDANRMKIDYRQLGNGDLVVNYSDRNPDI